MFLPYKFTNPLSSFQVKNACFKMISGTCLLFSVPPATDLIRVLLSAWNLHRPLIGSSPSFEA